MSINDFIEMITANDGSFLCNGKLYYFSNFGDIYRIVIDDGKEYSFHTVDDLLDKFLIDGEPLRTAVAKITDW